jgi:hypothetical protein
MKIKFLFTLISAALFHQLTFAQAYMKVGGGYAFSAGATNFSTPQIEMYRVSSTTNVPYRKEFIFGTLGSGGVTRLALGYNFNKNFGFELDMNYLIGAKKYVSSLTVYDTINQIKTYDEKSYAYTRQFRITPSFYVRASEGFIKPYAGMGIVLPLAGSTFLISDALTTSSQTYRVRKASGSFSVGFESYAGATCNWPNENFNLFVEVRYVALGVKPSKATVIQSEITNLNTGVVTNDLETMPTSIREINFVDVLDETSNVLEGPGGVSNNTDDTKPTDKIATTTNFNALGINFGIRMNLVKAKKAE